MRLSTFRSIKTAIGLALVASAALLALPAAAQPTKAPQMSTPTITCGEKTPVSLEIVFTAGSPTGAPAGFSLQWMTLADWQANDDMWFLSSDPDLCKGSFSGNAFGHFYNVPAGTSTSLIVGDLLFDNPGASTNCLDPLVCDTKYIFRAFSHANSKFKRSDFSSDLVCKTKPCTQNQGCTFTQGYWKTHGPGDCQFGNNSDVWPVNSLSLGDPGTTYTDAQLCSILRTPAKGNGLIALAHQLIATKLNIANSADPGAISAAVAAADALIGTLVVPPVGAGSLHPSVTSGLTTTLDSYNSGAIGPGHCQ